MGDAEMCGGQKSGLEDAQPLVQTGQPFGYGDEGPGIRLRARHAASRWRNVTITDFEVGVSLSSPALPSGTRTFSSG